MPTNPKLSSKFREENDHTKLTRISLLQLWWIPPFSGVCDLLISSLWFYLFNKILITKWTILNRSGRLIPITPNSPKYDNCDFSIIPWKFFFRFFFLWASKILSFHFRQNLLKESKREVVREQLLRVWKQSALPIK